MESIINSRLISALFVFPPPQLVNPRSYALLGRIGRVGVVELFALQRVWHKLLLDKVAGKIVGIFVILAITLVAHQVGDGIAQV